MKAESTEALSHARLPVPTRVSDRFLAALAPFERVVLVSHVNPDPDALASMLALKALLDFRQPGKEVVLTIEGILARAENQAMARFLQIPLLPIGQAQINRQVGVVMVDSQPRTGRRADEAFTPTAVIDHHETGGSLDGVAFQDIRPASGATSTMVLGYLMEQDVPVSERLATALLYGVESEISGYPREATEADDQAVSWLYPRADKDDYARIRNPRLPQSYFATFQHALSNAFLYGDVIVTWCGEVSQPDIVPEVADFFVRFERVNWALAVGLYDHQLRLSARSSQIDGHAGEVLRKIVDGLGSAGGHDKRAGGSIPLPEDAVGAFEPVLRTLRERLLHELGADVQAGHRLLESCPMVQVP